MRGGKELEMHDLNVVASGGGARDYGPANKNDSGIMKGLVGANCRSRGKMKFRGGGAGSLRSQGMGESTQATEKLNIRRSEDASAL